MVTRGRESLYRVGSAWKDKWSTGGEVPRGVVTSQVGGPDQGNRPLESPTDTIGRLHCHCEDYLVLQQARVAVRMVKTQVKTRQYI